ncbi:copper resistance CopC/CopD family protein [Bacillus haynesii]|nr:copper resistance CopC/CopD family protein [Bacillus haynesii]MCY8079215.1 copper resistance CopC/CopD family protein [Bacillus haynesii]MCY8384357.1 copper resistance CopC/CopD family protein [Bacillus haynesii]MCY8588237.1 copper resistance CopC/CopD family protein [Bacillus haynesii]
MKRATLWAVLAVLCTILLPKAAFAHAYIVNSTPAENQELKKAPAEIKIEFNEAIQKGFHSITVRNSSGERVDSGKTEIDPQNAKIMTVKLKPKLQDDIYSAEWRAVSADGHPVSGTIPFSIGNIQGGLPKDQQNQASGLPAADTVIERVLLYTGFSLFIGAALFQLVWHRPENGWPGDKRRRLKRIKNAALLLTGAAIIIQLPLQTKANAGVSWSGAFQPSLLQETLLNTTGGMLWLINIAIIALLVFCSNRKGLKSAILSLFLFAGLLFVKSLDGHAASTSAGYMTTAMNFIHLNAASIWTGGLAMFVLFFGKDWLKSDKNLIWETIRRFSPWALVSAGLLIFSGLFNSFFIVHTLDNLFGTAYGKALLVKSVLVLLMIGLGAFHYFRFRKAPKQQGGRSMKAEWAVGLLILLTTAVFTNIPSPPAPLPQPFSETKELTEGNTLSLRISPNMPGSNTFEVTVRNRKGDVVKDIQKIELTVEKTGLFADDKESTFSLSKNKDGVFQTKNLNLNEDGIWKIRVHGLTASFEEIRTVFNAKINKKEF